MSKKTIADRLDAAGLSTERFVNVNEGEKGTFDHSTHAPGEVRGNYGIYTFEDDDLVIFDIDDYEDVDDPSGLSALAELPPTLEQQSPHGGTHRLYRVEPAGDRRAAAVVEDAIDVTNPGPSWGEIRVQNQYVVGAGSELDGCEKEWCDECATPDGGQYSIASDREIATITAEDLLDVLEADPVYADAFDESDQDGSDSTNASTDTADVLSYALNDSDDDKLQRLWRGDYSDYDDRSTAECALAYKLAFWLQGDKRAVRDAMNGRGLPSDVSSPQLSKWEDREDDSYRDSVLEAVDEQTEYFDPDSGRNDSQQPAAAPDTADADLWNDIRWLYEDPEVPNKHARTAAVNRLLEQENFMTLRDTDAIWRYDPERGFYEPRGETYIKEVLAKELGHHYRKQERREIVEQVRARTYIDRTELNAGGDPDLLCVGNGVYDIGADELRDHSPEYYFTRGVEVNLPGDDTDPEAIERWLDSVTSREADKQTLLEMVGAALSPRYEHGKFLILFGEGSNGKSTFFDLVEALLGEHNVSGWTLQDLSENRFANADLVGKFANVAPDMPGKRLKETGTLKTLTGGDQTMAERKGEDAFEFTNSATLMFGANRPPAIPEPSRAVKRRIVPVRFQQQFTSADDDNPDKRNKDDLLEELTTEEELQGLLSLAVDGLQRLRDQGDVSLPETLDERMEYYEQFSDPIKEFRVNALENADGARVKKSNVYDAYTAWCHANNYEPANRSVFFKQLSKSTLTVDESRPKIDGEQVRVLNNVKFTDVGLDHAPSELLQIDTDDDSGEDRSQPADPDHVAVSDIDPAEQDVASVVGEVEFGEFDGRDSGEDTPAWTATLSDGTGEAELVVWEEHNIPEFYDSTGVFEADGLDIRGAEVSEYDGRLQLVIGDATTVYEAPADGQNQLDSHGGEAAADGGEAEVAGLRARIEETIRTDYEDGESVTVGTLAGHLDADPADVAERLETIAAERRMITEKAEREYKVL